MFIIVGLGNVGPQFENTFHNIGFEVVNKIAQLCDLKFTKEKYKSFIAEGQINGQKVILCKPKTFMNNSGEAVVMLKQKFKDAQIIVAVDDIDLPQGMVRYRQKGSGGTHNGMRSIVSYIGEDFERVKVGIGRDNSMNLADYVLSKIKSQQREVLNKSIEEAAQLIINLIK